MNFAEKEWAEGPLSFRVIVPAWQVAEYLGEALESVREQPFGQWVCHVVDDGSVDETGAIADEFCRKDARFRVTHQRNGGVSKARNRALAVQAREREYVLFLDADDCLAPGCLAWAAELIQREGANCLEWGFIDAGKGEISEDAVATRVCEGADILRFFVQEKILYGYICRGTVNLEAVKRIQFNERLSKCEDMLWWAEVVHHLTRVVRTNRVAYIYRRRPGQATARRTRRSYACQLEAYGKAYRVYLKDPRMDEALRQLLRRVVAQCIVTETVAMAMYGEGTPCVPLRDFMGVFRQENLPLEGLKGRVTRLLAWPVLGEVTALALAGAGWMLRIRRGA